ncbi:uncharacterized protein V6R79_019097 [Siganus canaliculatus]
MTFNATLTPPPLSFYERCLRSRASSVLYSVYSLTNVLVLLPLYVLVLSMGLRRRRPANHSDVFTFHCVVVELLGAVGSLVYSVGIWTRSGGVLTAGALASGLIFPGQTLFHTLTCVDRFLAVVRPVAYVRLQRTRGVRLRDASVAAVWLLCLGWMGITGVQLPDFPVVPLLCTLSGSIALITFCCLSVLRVLGQSGPGEVGGAKRRADQSKRRALHIMFAVMGVLLLRFAGLLVTFGLSFLDSLALDDLCVVLDCGILLVVPSSLVLPLLFLHKAGRLASCRLNAPPRK